MKSTSAFPQAFLAELAQQGIYLQAHDTKLKVNAPKGKLTPALRERIATHKAALLQHLNNDIPRQTRPQDLPCSFAQQRLWLLEHLEPNTHAYNVPLFLRASGELNLEVLQRALQTVIQRHEVLRTHFIAPEGDNHTALQRVLPSPALGIQITNLQDLDADQQDTEVQRLAQQEQQRNFDLNQGNLLHLHVVQLNPQEHVLLLSVHHIIFDGLSLAILLRELRTLYSAYLKGETNPLAELTVQYADFSVWQRQHLSGENLEQQLIFWRETLQDAPPLLGLPTDHPRPATQSYQGARHPFELTPALSEQFRQLAQHNAATLFMAFQTALSLLLARYTGKQDILMGAPVANRNHPQLEGLIGFFANSVVLRTQIENQQSFNDLLQANKHTILQAFKHQELPFEKLVDELHIERSMSHNPLFQVLFSFQNAHTDGFQLPNVDIQPLVFEHTVSKFDLSFIIREHQSHFTIIIEYNTGLFNASSIAQMQENLQALLQVIVEQPQQAVANLDLFTAHNQQTWQQWNATQTGFDLTQGIIQQFEAQAARTPEATALVFEEQHFSYQQLNAQVNQLSHYLLQHTVCGQQHNPLVIICCRRSPALLISLLATLKAGAAYVPIDPNYPQERIQYMLDDSGATLILTQTSIENCLDLPEDDHRQQLCLDHLDYSAYPTHNPPQMAQTNDLAYVIYTSGSTGKPKGVMIEHCNLANFLQDMQQRTAIHSQDKLLAVTTLSFDIAALELYLPLVSGACLHLAPQHLSHDANELQDYLHSHAINFMQATPATWQLLRHNQWQASHALNVLCGGEALPADLANYLLDNSQRLWNVYGPTETTIWSATSQITTPQNYHPPIGKPMANTRIYILDADLNPQPTGIPGELCIAGEGLARGYLNRAELTAEKFVSTQLLGREERIYRTGDLARWQPDGNLEYLGRFDHQVKIRGFRIELGEIETLLARHPQVRESLVIARPSPSGEQQLVAYVLLDDPDTPSDTLKQHLHTKLPDYMIPAFFVTLDSFPLLPNGKINRHALPEPDRFNTHQSQAYMHPRNSLEMQLSQIWEQILNVSPISVYDDFFAIGGDSLLSIRLLNAVNRHFETKIPLNALFQHSTIEALGILLHNEHAHTPTNTSIVGLQTQGQQAPIFCVHAAGGIVFRYLQIAKLLNTQHDHPFYGLQARGIELGETPFPSIEIMAQHYVAAIQSIKPHGPYLLAGWSMGGTVAFEMARLLEQAGEHVSGLIMIDAPSPYMNEVEADDIDFLLERLEPAAGIDIQANVEQQQSVLAKKQFILEQKKQLGLFPPDTTLEEAEQRLTVHRHHNELLCQYQPHDKIHCDIAFIRADEETSFDEKMKDPLTEWKTFTHQNVLSYNAPGNHFNMFSNEHSPILANTIHQCIQDLGIPTASLTDTE